MSTLKVFSSEYHQNKQEEGKIASVRELPYVDQPLIRHQVSWKDLQDLIGLA